MMEKYQLRCFIDETSAPYEEGENPFPRMKEDDVFEKKMIEKYGLVLGEGIKEE